MTDDLVAAAIANGKPTAQQPDIATVKAELPPEWVLAQRGFALEPDGTGRLIGMCPFHEDSSPSFAVFEQAGEERVGCWSCDRTNGDVLDLIGWLTGTTDARKQLRIAGELLAHFRTDAAWAARPPAAVRSRPKADPADLTAHVQQARERAASCATAIERLLDEKSGEPGFALISADYLRNEWLVGVEDDWEIVIPHFSLADDGTSYVVRAFKTRTGRSKPMARLGSDLSRLYGEWKLDPHRRDLPLVLCEGESDTWAAHAALRTSHEVLGLPHGAHGGPRSFPSSLHLFAGRDVVLAFDGDTAGRAASQAWSSGLRGLAATVRVAQLPDGQDLSDTQDLAGIVGSATDVTASTDGTSLAAETGDEGYDDDVANAMLFAETHRHYLRWVPARRTWIDFDLTKAPHWRYDTGGGAAKRYAMKTARHLRLVAAAEEDPDRRARLTKRAQAAGNRSRIEAMIELGKAFMELDESALDTDPWKLNVQNGTLDLRTGELHPHSSADLITRVTPVHWDPHAESSRWAEFLRTSIPDEGARAFVQRLAGYILTGVATEEIFVFIHGPAGSGKSTFVDALAATLGQYAAMADPALFLRSQRPSEANSATPALVHLVGARFAVSNEPPKGRAWDESMIKRLTGGDTMTARQLHGTTFEFKPQFTLVVVGNSRPPIEDDAGGAMARRLVEVPFNVRAGERRDDSLKTELCDPAVSGSAILRWAVTGCLEWQKTGLAIPETVQEATLAYWDEQAANDPVRAFLEERFERVDDTSALMPRKQLSELFNETAGPKLTAQALNTRLRELGLTERKSMGVMCWEGLRLLDVAEVRPIRRHADWTWASMLQNAVPTSSAETS